MRKIAISCIIVASSLFFTGCGSEIRHLDTNTSTQNLPVVAEDANLVVNPKTAVNSSITSNDLVDDQIRPDYIFTVDPAEIKTISFSNFGFRSENGASQEDLSNYFEDGNIVISSTGQPGNLSSNEIEARVVGRQLVVVAPVLPFSDAPNFEQLLTLTADNNESVRILIQTRQSAFGARVEDTRHFIEDESSEEVYSLPVSSVEGLEPSGNIGQTDFTLSLSRGGPILAKGFRAFIFIVDEDYKQIDVQDISAFVSLDPNRPALTLSAQTIQRSLQKLSFGQAELDFAVPQAKDHNNLSVQFFNGQTVLKGQLVDEDGLPISPDTTDTGPLEILMKGMNSKYRRVVNVNPDGSFYASGIPSGETYFMVVSDLRFPNLFSTFKAISDNTAEANVEVLYAPRVK